MLSWIKRLINRQKNEDNTNDENTNSIQQLNQELEAEDTELDKTSEEIIRKMKGEWFRSNWIE